MRCCFCNRPLTKEQLVARYGPGPDAHCPLPCKWCQAPTADPYLEQDAVLVLLDLVLHKPAVYRHLLYNRRGTWWLCVRLFGLLVWFWWYVGRWMDVVTIPVFLVPCYLCLSVLFGERPPTRELLMAIMLAQFARSLNTISVIFNYHSPTDDWLTAVFCYTATVESVMAVCHVRPLPAIGRPSLHRHRLPMAYLFAHTAVLIGSFCRYKVGAILGQSG